MGQSNMAGRGFARDVPLICNQRIQMLRNGRWQMMAEPLHNDRPVAGIGPGASFAAAWCQHNSRGEVGLIPCADGATSLDDWAVGGVLFDHAVFQAKLAMRTSTLDGVLWHQGENDSTGDRHLDYQDKLEVILNALRRELGNPQLPLVVGGLGEYLGSGSMGQYFAQHALVTQELEEFCTSRQHCYFVTAAWLSSNPDGIHLDAVSQRIFGLRYFEAYHRRTHVLEPLENEQDALNIDNRRPRTKEESQYLLNLDYFRGLLSAEEYGAQLARIEEAFGG